MGRFIEGCLPLHTYLKHNAGKSSLFCGVDNAPFCSPARGRCFRPGETGRVRRTGHHNYSNPRNLYSTIFPGEQLAPNPGDGYQFDGDTFPSFKRRSAPRPYGIPSKRYLVQFRLCDEVELLAVMDLEQKIRQLEIQKRKIELVIAELEQLAACQRTAVAARQWVLKST